MSVSDQDEQKTDLDRDAKQQQQLWYAKPKRKEKVSRKER
jgi:hypothetical protein